MCVVTYSYVARKPRNAQHAVVGYSLSQMNSLATSHIQMSHVSQKNSFVRPTNVQHAVVGYSLSQVNSLVTSHIQMSHVSQMNSFVRPSNVQHVVVGCSLSQRDHFLHICGPTTTCCTFVGLQSLTFVGCSLSQVNPLVRRGQTNTSRHT